MRHGKGLRPRRVGAAALTVLAVLLVWVALTAPNRLDEIEPAAFVRLPVEALGFVALVLLVPTRVRGAMALAAGVVLGILTVLRVLDLAFLASLNRPFDVAVDWSYADSLVELMRDSFGATAGTVMLVVAAVILLALLVLIPLALLRITRLLARHRRASLQTVVALAAAWLLFAVVGVHVTGAPVASAGTAHYAYREVTGIPAMIRDQHAFEKATVDDPLRQVPSSRLLRGLRGKDVLFVFVESYGRVAVQDSSFSPAVTRVLDAGTRRLQADGFSARSAFLTSPTFGAISWLAHSTLQSGLWVNSQQRYDVLVKSRRSTLSQAFERAGWRTVADVPANTRDWPEARFYGYDRLYDSRNVGYAGPRFGYPTMPDQFTLDAFHRLELAKTDRPPVMAEIDLLSSHAPWSRTPRMVDPSTVGDGSVFDAMPETLPSEKDIWPSPTRVKAAYGRSIEYSLTALVSFVQHHGTDRTVLVALGDHQPATIVSGQNPGHDVPISVIARDPAVLDRISGWGWQEGLRPSPDAPVWRMDDFRSRFLAAYDR
jgi:hypothetical protein